MRIVLDTNILISAYVFPGGSPETVYRMVLDGAVELVTTRPLLAEFGRILETKFGWDAGRAEEAVRQVGRLSVVVEPDEKLAVIPSDPADDAVLEAAVAGGAEYIVSGDKHILGLASFRSIAILDPAGALSALRDVR